MTVKQGKTLGEGLAKAMKLRDFDTEDCDVYDRRTGYLFLIRITSLSHVIEVTVYYWCSVGGS